MLKMVSSSYFAPYKKQLSQLEDSFLFLKSEAPEIFEQVKKTTLSGGKHLRPLMVFMSSEIFRLSQEKALILAASAEVIHAASLCHDDVLDEATVRRDLPTLNVLQGNKLAILSGDFLFSLALKNLCQLKNIRVVETASNMIADLSQGEWTQENCRKSRSYPEGSIEKIAYHKTASLFAWAFTAPVLSSEQATSSDEKLARIVGEELGLAFQIVDDVLDFTLDSGKEPFIDLKRGILNSVTWDYFANNKLLEAFEQGQVDTAALCQLERFETSVRMAKGKAQEHIFKARTAFASLLQNQGQNPCDPRFQVFEHITQGLLNKI